MPLAPFVMLGVYSHVSFSSLASISKINYHLLIQNILSAKHHALISFTLRKGGREGEESGDNGASHAGQLFLIVNVYVSKEE